MKKIIIFVMLILMSTLVIAETSDPKLTVDSHNMYRNQLNSGVLGNQTAPNPMIPDLVWDQQLAESADVHSKKCVWEHSQRSYVGENLYAGSYSNVNVGMAVKSWVDEHEDYKYPTGSTNGGVVGHYTQVIWENTTKVGCAQEYCSPIMRSDGSRMWSGTIVTCQYSPPGNYVGQPPYKINGSNDARANYDGYNGNLYSGVNVGDNGYRVKFDLIEWNPLIFRVIAFKQVPYLESFNRSVLYPSNELIIETFSINNQGDFSALFIGVGNLDFKLIEYKEE